MSTSADIDRNGGSFVQVSGQQVLLATSRSDSSLSSASVSMEMEGGCELTAGDDVAQLTFDLERERQVADFAIFVA